MRVLKLFFPLFIFLFCSCSTKKQSEERFIADWEVKRQPNSHATLHIYLDHSFSYNESGHLDKSYSKGFWNLQGDTLVLHSQNPKDCHYLVSFSKKQEHPEPSPKNPMKKSLGFTSVPGCEPDQFSEAFVEFKKERFLRSGDSLLYLDLSPEVRKRYGNYRIYKK